MPHLKIKMLSLCFYTKVGLLPVGTDEGFVLEVKLTKVFVLCKTETLILKIIIGVTCFGVAVGVILLGGALPGTGKCKCGRASPVGQQEQDQHLDSSDPNGTKPLLVAQETLCFQHEWVLLSTKSERYLRLAQIEAPASHQRGPKTPFGWSRP